VYWVVDLRAGLLCVFGEPRDGEYGATSQTATPGDFALPSLDGVTVDLRELFR
jgi:hypothetical protein